MAETASLSKRVLLVEDEPGLVITLTDRLRSEGYDVQAASDGPSGLERATREPWDVILLDVMLPGASGFDVCRDLRQRGVTTPVIMLTARGQVVDKVLGLKLGADDYLTKPFDMMELTARIEVQLRRRAAAALSASATQYRFGDIHVDFRKAEVTRNGRPEVWGYHSMPSTRTVDVHVAWLRQKIEPNPRHPQYLLTVHGMGYKFIG